MWTSENRTIFILRLRLFPSSQLTGRLRFHSGSGAESRCLQRVVGTTDVSAAHPTGSVLIDSQVSIPLSFSVFQVISLPRPECQDKCFACSWTEVESRPLSLHFTSLCSQSTSHCEVPLSSLWISGFCFRCSPPMEAGPVLKCSPRARENRAKPDLLFSSYMAWGKFLGLSYPQFIPS